MLLPSLENLPVVSLPEGYCLREASREDEGSLLSILASAFPEFGWDSEKLDNQILGHEHVFGAYLLEKDGKGVGTVSGIIWPAEPSQGYVHWLGVHEDSLGQGLGLKIMLLLLHEFARRGLKSAILDTDDGRLPAIATYIKLGFEPLIVEEGQEERWRGVRAALKG